MGWWEGRAACISLKREFALEACDGVERDLHGALCDEMTRLDQGGRLHTGRGGVGGWI